MVSHAVLHLKSNINNSSDRGVIRNKLDETSADQSTVTVHCAKNDMSNTLPLSAILTSLTLHIHDVQQYDPLSLASLMPYLRKDGQGVVHLHCYALKDDTTTVTKAQNSMMLAGLTPESELLKSNECRIFTARLKNKSSDPGRKIGSLGGQNRRINRSTVSKVKLNHKLEGTAVVKINMRNDLLLNSEEGKYSDIFDEYDDEFIDEDNLLDLESTRVELAPPPSVDTAERSKAAYDDCGGRKACDNCTCGRAEAEQAALPVKATSSACGNCSKGDAFRCAGCPYLGKPAFKEGEEHLVLDLTDDL